MKTLADQTTWTSNPMTHTGMSAADYTAFLQAERQEAEARRLGRTLANIARRAETLWADGYRLSPGEDGLFFVHSPKGDCYRVWHGEEVGDDCTCPAFAKYGECKHHLAVKLKEAEDAAADAAFEREQEIQDYFESRYEAFLES